MNAHLVFRPVGPGETNESPTGSRVTASLEAGHKETAYDFFR